MLCGGLGTRLRPALPDTPKALAPIAGRAFLDLLLEHLSAQGLRHFVLCTGYRADDIEARVGDLSRWGELRLSVETEPLGTGGALAHSLHLARSEPILVLNGDSFIGVDLAAMLAFHRERESRLTLAVVPSERGQEGGALSLSEAGEVVAFREKRELAGRSYLNGGIYLMQADVLSGRAPGAAFSLEQDVFPQLVAERMYGFVHDGPLVDIGTPERYAAAAPALVDAGLRARGR